MLVVRDDSPGIWTGRPFLAAGPHFHSSSPRHSRRSLGAEVPFDMAITLRCTGCRSKLQLRDELGGKKVKCPRCQTVLLVPQPEKALVEAAVEKAGPGHAAPRRPTGRTGKIQGDQPAPRRPAGVRVGRDPEPESEEILKRAYKPSKYKPCPQCGSEDPAKVKWTAWGSFYGPRLFSHVRCQACDYCYNGKTGRSNFLAAAVFVAMPLLGILAILGGIVYIVAQRGHLG